MNYLSACVAIDESTIGVMLSAAKHLGFAATLRKRDSSALPQNDNDDTVSQGGRDGTGLGFPVKYEMADGSFDVVFG